MQLSNRPSNNPRSNTEEIKIKDVEQNTFSDEEIREYRELLINREQRERLEQWRMTIEELSEISREQLSDEVESDNSIRESLRRGREINNQWNESQNQDREDAETVLWRISETISNTWEQAREQTWELRQRVSQAESVSSVFTWLETTKNKWWFMWIIANILLKIAGFFWYKKENLDRLNQASERVNQAEERLEQALSPENIENIKETTIQTIEDSIWEYLTEENKQNLRLAIEWLNEEELNQLNQKIQSWELSISDIRNILPNLFNNILDEAQLELMKENLTEQVIDALKRSIKENYWIEIDDSPEKRQELENLVRQNLTISEDRVVDLMAIIQNNREIRYADLMPILWETAINWTKILIWLISKWIVPISNFAFDFAGSAYDMLKISASALWISSNISIENFHQTLINLPENERNMFIWLLYRKGWLFLNMVWSISEWIARLWIWAFTNTTVSWFDLFSDSITNKFWRQAQNMDRIASAIQSNNTIKPSQYLDDAIRNVWIVRDNYKLINILEQASRINWDDAAKIREARRLLNASWIQWLIINNNTNNFASFARELWSNRSVNIRYLDNRWAWLMSNMGFWARADLYRLNKQLETITNAQKRMFNPNFLSNWYYRVREAFASMNISRMWDRLSFHFDSPNQARDWLRRLNTLANRFPQLLRWTIDKLPIITVAWIAASSEEWFVESLKSQAPYLIPIIGPALIMMDSWWNWEDGYPKPLNPLNAWIWTALLTIDWAILGRQLASNWWRWAAWYMLKPFSDVYSIWRATADLAYSIWRTATRWWVVSWARLWISETAKRVKNIPWWTRVRALAMIWVIWTAWILYMINNWEEIEWIEDFMINWQLDTDAIYEVAWELTDGQKQDILEVLLDEDWIEDVEIRIINNRMIIMSRNPNIQSSWAIDTKYNEILQIEPEYNFEYIENV